MTGYASIVADALDRHVTPALASMGFATAASTAWLEGDLQIRAVIDSKASDPYRGGAFTLEFEVSDDGRFEEKLAGRVRVDQLLDNRQRSTFLALRNEIAERLDRPPQAHLETIPESIRAEYLEPFSHAGALEKRFWMRFRTADDVDAWSRLLASELPILVRRARSLSAHEMYMGRALEW